MTVDTITNGAKETLRLPAPSVAGLTALDSVLLEVDQEERRASVYVNCHLQGSVSLPWTPREMANDGDEDLRAVSRRGEELGYIELQVTFTVGTTSTCLAAGFSEPSSCKHRFPVSLMSRINYNLN